MQDSINTRKGRRGGLDGEVRIVRTRSVTELAGLLARPGQPALGIEDMDAAIAAAASEPADRDG